MVSCVKGHMKPGKVREVIEWVEKGKLWDRNGKLCVKGRKVFHFQGRVNMVRRGDRLRDRSDEACCGIPSRTGKMRKRDKNGMPDRKGGLNTKKV
jgi:hypothetical protein